MTTDDKSGVAAAAFGGRAAWLALPDTVPIEEAALTEITADLRRASRDGKQIVDAPGPEAEKRALIFILGTQPLVERAVAAIASVSHMLDRGDDRPLWLDGVARGLGSGLEECRAIRLQFKALLLFERARAEVGFLKKTSEEGERLSFDGSWLDQPSTSLRAYCDRAAQEIDHALLLLKAARSLHQQALADDPLLGATARQPALLDAIDKSTELTCSIAEHLMVLDWGASLMDDQETARADQAIEDDLALEPLREVREAVRRFFTRPSRGIKIERWRHELRHREGNLEVELPERHQFRRYMKRCVHGILRDNARRGPPPTNSAPNSDIQDDADRESRFNEILLEVGARLSRRQREVFVLKAQLGSVAAAARALGIDESSARTHYQRAVQKIQKTPRGNL